MKKILPMIFALLVIAGIVSIVVFVRQPESTAVVQQEEEEELVVADSAIIAAVSWSKVKDNTIVLSVEGLGGKYTKVAYEVSYETQGVVQGVTSRPVDTTGKDTFVRDDIYLGTCSRNVCRPHTGVKRVSVVLEFTDATGKKSQLVKDVDL